MAAGYPYQTDLAAAMEVDRARVSEWERGKVVPKGKTRKKLLELLGADEKSVFENMPAPSRQPSVQVVSPQPIDPDRAAEILQDLQVLLQRYGGVRLEQRLLALYAITLEEPYLTRYEALPDSDHQVSATLRRSLGTS